MCKNFVRDITRFFSIVIIFFLNSIVFPIPYKQETDAITITSLLPESRDEVVLSLSFSISSLIDKSFSIYVPVTGKYDSG